MQAVFKALADPTRRRLLDELFRQDGQTLGALERLVPLTRYGVMKHLRVLEDAGVVVTRRRGREKLHFLDPDPIRLVYEGWMSKYAEPWLAALSRLEATFEQQAKGVGKVYETYIETTPERLWGAIADPELRRRYNPGVGVTSDRWPGSSHEAVHAVAPNAEWEGEDLEMDPPRRLVQTFTDPSGKVRREGMSRVTWEIEPVGDSCRLRVSTGSTSLPERPPRPRTRPSRSERG